jgi:hypothetical protein
LWSLLPPELLGEYELEPHEYELELVLVPELVL